MQNIKKPRTEFSTAMTSPALGFMVTVRLYSSGSKDQLVKSVGFDDAERFAKFARFADVQYACFDGYQGRELPALPPRLQVLVFRNTRVEVFPELPPTVTSVFASKGRIRRLPDLSHLPELESLDLKDNFIEELTEALAPNLRTVDLSFNTLRHITTPLPASVTSLDLGFNRFESRPVASHACQINTDHMYSDEFLFGEKKERERLVAAMREAERAAVEAERAAHRARLAEDPGYAAAAAAIKRAAAEARATAARAARETALMNRMKTIYQDGQNVHNNHVQKAVSSSVEALMRMTADARLPSVDDIVTVLHMGSSGPLQRFLRPLLWFSSPLLLPYTYSWCADTAISSVHGITFRELLQRTMVVIEAHEHRVALRSILMQELRSSVGYCFTGRFGRVVNVLSGFVDGVGVTLSPREQMQARIAAAVGKAGDSTAAQVRAAVVGILDEFDVKDAYERDSWISAVDDQ